MLAHAVRQMPRDALGNERLDVGLPGQVVERAAEPARGEPHLEPDQAADFGKRLSQAVLREVAAGKSRSDATCSGVLSCVCSCSRRTSKTSAGTLIRWRSFVLVVFITSSP